MHAIPWTTIQDSLNTLQEVEGGYSHAHRGIITLADGNRMFVKIGVDDNTKNWAKREIEAYHLLAEHNYPYAPQLLATNAENTAFAVDPLLPENGWAWTNTWTEERLSSTLAAMDALATIKLDAKQVAYFSSNGISESQDGWRQLLASPESQKILIEKLHAASRKDIADTLDVPAQTTRSAGFTFAHDVLVHLDVRADNCAWNPQTKEVQLVDWNWAQLGDRGFDLSAFLVNVHKSGLDVLVHHADRLDEDALQWLAGYWLNSATQPLWPGASEKSTLRDYQLSSGIVALELLRRIHELRTIQS